MLVISTHDSECVCGRTVKCTTEHRTEMVNSRTVQAAGLPCLWLAVQFMDDFFVAISLMRQNDGEP